MADLFTRRSPSIPSTWDSATRVFEATVSSYAPVQRYGYLEKLSRKPGDWDFSRVTSPGGVPCLLDHARDDADRRVGKVLEMRATPKGVTARVRLNKSAAANRLTEEIEDGTVSGVSFGYTATGWEVDVEDGVEVRTAIGIVPYEISIVSVPADTGASIRSQEITMPRKTTKKAQPQVTDDEIDVEDEIEIDEPLELRSTDGRITRRKPDESTARLLCRHFQMTDDFYNRNKSKSTADLKLAILDELAARSDSTPIRHHIDVNAIDHTREGFIEAAGEALYARLRSSHKPSNDLVRSFMGLTLPELARRTLEASNTRTIGFSPATLISRALHSTSDFPLILGDAVGRVLRAEYQAAPSGLKVLARKTTAANFKLQHRLQLGEGVKGGLLKVAEGGEYHRGTIEESRESYALETFGRVFGISRAALINDDLNAFDRLPRMFGQMASAVEAKVLAGLINSNPQMSDGNAVFSTAHNNLSASSDPISISSISAARLAMRSQPGLSDDLISVTPKYLLVPPAQETSAELALAIIAAAKVDDVNPFSGKLELVVEPRLTSATAWYVSASPDEIDGLEYAYLESEQGPTIETRNGFDVDGVEIKARIDFGAGWLDHRSWFKNTGAAAS